MAVVARGLPGLTFAGTTPLFAMGSQRTLAKDLPRCWQSFDPSQPTPITSAIKEEVRKAGIPAGLRPDFYFVASGAHKLANDAPAGTYSALAASTADLADDVIFQVEDDIRVARILHKDETRLFSTAKGAEALSRVIFAYLQRGGSAYWKGLASVAAQLLTVFGREREEQAFWTLVALLERRFFPHAGGHVPAGARLEVHVLQQLLEQRQPALAALLAKLCPEPLEMLAGSWFSTAFARTLPHQVVLRVWDCVVVEGPKVALRVALAIIKMCTSSIQSCTSMEVLCRVVEGRLSRCTDADALLAIAFKGVGSLSGASVDTIRARVLAAAQQQQQQQHSQHGGAAAGGSAARARPLLLPPSAPMVMLGGGGGGMSGGSALTRSSGSSEGNGGGGGGSSASGSSRASPWPSPKGHALLSVSS
ncbi:hypothetical protein HYH02_012310 [Chlamydomonas schloesseri]|uniref:Rab-GAP TBC domain-containing protein n=1 Tax=Chlamydomonas schloesseri TaxID=2026947 RepID=A0A835TA97_9CHLO|nr:hypothetical protein HYH02_012310 [Chlamydomonas schloesseri]|eukprot:KAG2434481.1 hypothetical protein HYH02_012310 [Chlamydomonas schloesseri]